MPLSARVFSAITATLSSVGDFGNPTMEDKSDVSPIIFTDGAGNGQASKLFESKGRILAASASENLDLSGVLTDPLGAVLTFATIKAIEIRADATNTNDVVAGGAALNAFVGPFGAAADTIAVKPGGRLLIAAPNTGWAVTAGTGDLLKVANGGVGTAVKYDIKIIGT